MSRSGYSDDSDDDWAMIRYRGAVASAIRGKRGQKLLREALAALDAMDDKRLAHGNMTEVDGCRCALGVVAHGRGLEEAAARLDEIYEMDPEGEYYPREVAKVFDIAEALAREIVFINDELWYGSPETPEQRFRRVRNWLVENIKAEGRE